MVNIFSYLKAKEKLFKFKHIRFIFEQFQDVELGCKQFKI